MKVLTCNRIFLPGFKGGGPIHALKNMANHLKGEVEFKFATLNHDVGEEPYKNIVSNQWNQLDGLDIFYINEKRNAFRDMYNLIKNEDYDILYLNSYFDPFFTILPLFLFSIFRKNKKVIIAPRGEFSPGALGIKWLKKRIYIIIFKAFKMHKKVIWQASFEEDKNHIMEEMGRNIKIHLAPYLPQKMENQTFNALRSEKVRGTIYIIFVSRISRKKNLDYALRILRNIKGNVQFDIFGPKEDLKYWNTCEKIINTLPNNIHIEHKGLLDPKDVVDMFSRYHLFFFPTRGEDFGYVVLESLMGGCPVIISDQTPWKEFERKGIGADIPLNDEKYFQTKLQEFVDMNNDDFQTYSRNAFERAKEYCNNKKSIIQSRELFFQH